ADAKIFAYECADTDGRESQCVKNLWNYLDKGDGTRGIDQDTYLGMVKSCTEQDDGMFSGKANGGQCGNAVIYCLRNSIDPATQCADNKVTSDLTGCENGTGLRNPQNASNQNDNACQALL